MDELLTKYDFKEISKRTSISPSVLDKIINKKFDKIDELRLKGFIKILKAEFRDIDFSDLEEKAKTYYFVSDDSIKTGKRQVIEEFEKKDNNFKNYLIVLILIVIIGILLSYMNHNNANEIKDENNNTNLKTLQIEKNMTSNDINETNKTTILELNETNEINKTTILETNNSTKKSLDINLTVTPLEKVWFKVYYLDLNKSKEFMTSNPVELNGSRRMFMKFGHGMIKFFYNGKTIFPNSTRVTRVIVENGELNITKKRIKSFK